MDNEMGIVSSRVYLRVRKCVVIKIVQFLRSWLFPEKNMKFLLANKTDGCD